MESTPSTSGAGMSHLMAAGGEDSLFSGGPEVFRATTGRSA